MLFQNNSTSRSQPKVNASLLDWSTTPLKDDYDGHYVKVIDNFLTPEECAELIALAESDSEWKQAAVHYGLGANDNYVNTNYRNSERILRFDHEAAEVLYKRLLPYVQEFVKIQPGDEWEGVVGFPGRVEGKWELVGINERLSFLRYGKGNYFKGHCDGQLELPDGRKARVTLQIYLGDDGVQGGATRIWGCSPKQVNEYLDIEPKKGRVLIFQQRGIYHSGEEVKKGIKYALRSDFMFRNTIT